MRQQLQAKPFIKWAGGKSKLIPQIAPLLPKEFGTYYEPFLGGGSLFFWLQPDRALLSDVSLELIETYRAVRDCCDEVIDILARHAELHDSDYYYAMRAAKLPTPVQRAARMIYLNKTCFNGLYRVNASGQFSTPIGSYTKPAICDSARIKEASRALRGRQIVLSDYSAVLSSVERGDFVYFDPPYDPLSDTASFTGYTEHKFTDADQVLLRDFVMELTDRGVQLAVSNSDTEFIRRLYVNFHVHTIKAARAINSKASERNPINELFITNY